MTDVKQNLQNSISTKNIDVDDLSFDEFDEFISPRAELTDFDQIVESALSRRGFIGGVIGFGLSNFLLSTSAYGKALKNETSPLDFFEFDAVEANGLDTITLPKGYNFEVVVQWGDPLWSDGQELDETTGGSAHSQLKAFGDNNDGMSLFTHQGHELLVVNNEYINKRTLFPETEKHRPASEHDAAKSKAAHGVSVLEIKIQDKVIDIIKDSPFNRRITADTEMEITGPAAGHALLQTDLDPSGLEVNGTFNNCGNGQTPWGTYLTCEENFNGYFASSDKTLKLRYEETRYGVGIKDKGYSWYKFDDRFDISKHRNEANRHGYIVEIDPRDPKSRPKKLTRLGRFKHENAEVIIAKDGRVVVYMGDDERGEFLYRFVSRDKYVEGQSTERLLSKGTLYAAKFYDDQRGVWLPLTPETTGLSEAEICIYTRIAASKVKATTMDRPEWVTAHPQKAEVYCALTNNKNRGLKPNKGGDDMPVGGPNPRAKNVYGQILKWTPEYDDHTATGFEWSLYALAGNPDVHQGLDAGSQNINASNMFNSPDGLAFDSRGRLWIQTDGQYSDKGDFAGMGNNQMLVGNTQTGEIRRFLVGPKECEVTGVCWSQDKTVMFVGIQHPGERGGSHFPLGQQHVPRSCVIAVRRDDGLKIG